jgi:hypothetical protein
MMMPRITPSKRTEIDRFLNPGEHVVLETRQHPIAVAASFAQALALLVPLAMVSWGIAGLPIFRNDVGHWLVRIILVAMFVVAGRLFWRVLGWELALFIITTEKVMHIHGVFGRRIASTPLSKVSEVVVHQSPFGRMFGYGRLLVDAPGGGRPLHGLTFLPDPAGLYTTLDRAARTERAYEGGALLGHEYEEVEVGTQHEPHWFGTSHSASVTPSEMPPLQAPLPDDDAHTTVIQRHLDNL